MTTEQLRILVAASLLDGRDLRLSAVNYRDRAAGYRGQVYSAALAHADELLRAAAEPAPRAEGDAAEGPPMQSAEVEG